MLATLAERARNAASSLTPVQKAFLVVGALLYTGLSVALIVAGDEIFHAIARASSWFAKSPYGVPALYAIMTVLAFPPTVGFGTSVTMCGMAFGSAREATDLTWGTQSKRVFGAYLVATGGYVLGSTTAFVVLHRLVSVLEGRWQAIRSAKSDPRFGAVQTAVYQSGVWVAVLIRFCPVPFCYANLIFALLDAVTIPAYIAASLITSPRLLLHVFVGAKMYELMDRDVRSVMDPTTRMLSVISVVAGICAGVGASWFVDAN